MRWIYSSWLLTLLSLFVVTTTEVSGAFMILPLYVNKCSKGVYNCGSGTSYCDIVHHKLVIDKKKSELCASDYLDSIKKCDNFACFVRTIPENLCKCDTETNTVQTKETISVP